MKRLNLLSLNLLIITGFIQAQQIELTGQISIHNSGYQTGEIEYVADAYVESPFAGSTSSDTAGKFNLTFSGIERGNTISLSVEKAGLEVVNEKYLLNVILGRKQPLKVFLAPKSELAKRQTEFYEVSLAAITKRHDALIASLRANDETTIDVIRQLELQLNKEIAHRFEAEEILNEQLEAAKERLPDVAKRLAEVNLDFASATYRNAYEAYHRGEIQSALDVLNEEELSSKTKEIFTSLDSIEQGQQDYQLALEIEMDKASQLYESYALKADAYRLIFDYRSAVMVLKKGVALLELVKDDEDIELTDAYGNLSYTLQDLGVYLEALTYQLKSIHIEEQLLTTYNEDLATSYNNLATIYLNLGDYEKALASQQKALAILEQVFEPNDPSIAIFYNNLALIYQSLGQYEDALNAQQKALAIREQVFEPNHPSIATSYNNLALIYQNLGQYEDALATQQKALAIIEQVLEPNHPRIAISCNNLAGIYQDLGDYDAALNAQQKALAIIEQVFEPNHPNIAISYNTSSTIYLYLGQYDNALAAQQKALAILEQVFEPNHPTIAYSYNNLAIIYQNLRQYDAALAAQQKDIAILEQVLEPNHPRIAISYNNLALIYQDLGQYDDALAAQQKALAILEQVFEPNHPNIAISYSTLATIYLYLGQYDDALAAQQKALAIQKQVLEPNHPNIAASFHSLAYIFYHQGQLDSAIVYERQAFEIWNKKLPNDHPTLQVATRSLAFFYPKRAEQRWVAGQYQLAVEDYERALEFSEEQAELYNEIGLCYYYTSNYSLAIENYEKSYQQKGVKETSYLNNTGMAYAKLGELTEAKVRFTQLEELLPENGLPYRDWGLYYVLKGESETALDNLEKAIQLGYNNWEWLRTEEALDPLRELPRFQALLNQAPTQNE